MPGANPRRTGTGCRGEAPAPPPAGGGPTRRSHLLPPQQLRFGSEVTQRVQLRRAHWDSGICYQDRDIFEAFLKLPVPQRRVIREVILTFAKVHSPPGA